MTPTQPRYQSLISLLNGRLFEIPEYQRAYSWRKKERNDLFADIEKTHQKGVDFSHFMAAIICLRRNKRNLGTDVYEVMDVVDGQQRLTTLIILLKAIFLALDSSDLGQERLKREFDELLVKVGSDTLLLLQTNHDSSNCFSEYLRTGKAVAPDEAKTISDRETLNAIVECKEFVKRWIDRHGDILSLAAILKNRLFFLMHEVADEKTVYTVFEVLNSRGLDVPKFDSLKSILMGAAFEMADAGSEALIRELQTIWRMIYEVIGLRQELSAESLRFAATLKAVSIPSKPLSEADAVDVLRERSTSAQEIGNTARWLLKVVQACNAVTKNNRINAVTEIAQARLLATAIQLRDDLKFEERESLMAIWEKVSFRIYGMLRHDARTRVGDYVRLAWRIINEQPSCDDIRVQITEIGRAYPIAEAVKALHSGNCYSGWETELRYILFRYEEHLAELQGQRFSNDQWERIWSASASDSIEHIWAQSVASDSHVHRLGNLVLLPPGLNSSLKNKPLADKAAAYLKTGLLMVQEVLDGTPDFTWTAAQIETREEQLLRWVASEWAD
jgi:hypothetical protein